MYKLGFKRIIMEEQKFAVSGWNLLSIPAKRC